MISSSRDEVSIYRLLNHREIINSYSARAFRRDLQASSHFVQRFKLLHSLEGHDGCVNTIQFTSTGESVITGSDDTTIKFFNVASGKQVQHIPTFHTNNIFYAKDLPSVNGDIKWLVSCAADGRVGLVNLHVKSCRLLYRHRGRAHRVALMPTQPDQFLSCGEDGYVCLFDIRDKTQRVFSTPIDQDMLSIIQANDLPSLKLQFKPRGRAPVSVYGIGSNPGKPHEIAVAGAYAKIAIYDLRSPTHPVHFLCPQHLQTNNNKHITGLKYSYNGELIVASYNDEDVYTFFSSGAPPSSPPLPSHTEPTANNTVQEAAAQEGGSGALQTATKCVSRVFQSLFGYASVRSSSSLQAASSPELEDAYSARCYFQRYSGHRNSDTVKQVNFLGGQSEFVVSGSDCGHIFIWDTVTSRLVKVLKGDDVGAVNCLNSHPSLPILATSGLESEAKLWAPIGEYDKDEEQRLVQDVVRENAEGGQRRRPMVVSRSMIQSMLHLLAQRGIRVGEEEGEDEEGDGEPARQRRRIVSMEEFIRTFLDSVEADEDAYGTGENDSDGDEEDEEEDESDNEESSQDDGDGDVMEDDGDDGSESEQIDDNDGEDESDDGESGQLLNTSSDSDTAQQSGDSEPDNAREFYDDL
ncbi:hypothetical protein EON65_15165 [archaeon]|nr:MAG: hypothetical protein EON65_15165 [archaeon]